MKTGTPFCWRKFMSSSDFSDYLVPLILVPLTCEYILQASNWAPDVSMGKVCMSMLFIVVAVASATVAVMKGHNFKMSGL